MTKATRPPRDTLAGSADFRRAGAIGLEALQIGLLVAVTADGLFNVTHASAKAGLAASLASACFFLVIKPLMSIRRARNG